MPNDSKILVDELCSFQEILKRDLKHFSLFNILRDVKYYFKVKYGENDEKNYRYIISRSPWNLGHFDVAIGYVANVSTQVFSLADRVNATKKIAWIHGETTDLKDTSLFNSIYNSFDNIFCVSQVSRNHFVERFTECTGKTDVYYNPIDREAVLIGAEEPADIDFSTDYFNIVSVGRLSPEKGFSMIPIILRILIDHGIHVKWYLIGDGSEHDKILQKANEFGTQNNLILLGTLKNPYPYMKACDVYVQPSYEEGYSTTICEAGILGKAIVGTTTSGGIREQIEDGVSGILAEPTPESLAEKIRLLVCEPTMRRTFEKNIMRNDYSHRNEIEKLIRTFIED